MDQSTPVKTEAVIIESATSEDDNNDEMRQSIFDLVEDMVHSLRCRSLTCCRANCKKFKWTISHFKTCKKTLGTTPCVPCGHLFMLVCFHSHNCAEPETSPRCKLIGCPATKQYLKQARQRKQRKITDNPNISTSTACSQSSTCDELVLTVSSNPSVSISSSLPEGDNEVQIKIEPKTEPE